MKDRGAEHSTIAGQTVGSSTLSPSGFVYIVQSPEVIAERRLDRKLARAASRGVIMERIKRVVTNPDHLREVVEKYLRGQSYRANKQSRRDLKANNVETLQQRQISIMAQIETMTARIDQLSAESEELSAKIRAAIELRTKREEREARYRQYLREKHQDDDLPF